MGEAGRKSSDIKFALDWLRFQKTGFTHWRNPRELRRRVPKPEALEQARKIIGN